MVWESDCFHRSSQIGFTQLEEFFAAQKLKVNNFELYIYHNTVVLLETFSNSKS